MTRLADAFDPAFFARKYRRRFAGWDLRDPQQAFALYKAFAAEQALDPNGAFCEAAYVEAHLDVAARLQAREAISGFALYLESGEADGHLVAPALTFDVPCRAPEPGGVAVGRIAGAAHTLCLGTDEYADLFLEFDPGFFHDRYAQALDLPDGADARTLFGHYLLNVTVRRLDPNPHFAERYYLKINRDVRDGVRAGELLCGLHHWVLYGRAEDRPYDPALEGQTVRLPAALTHAHRQMLWSMFDRDRYAAARNLPDDIRPEDAFEDFLKSGLARGDVPVDALIFDEAFYLDYYADVAAAKAKGKLASGLYHYVVAGRDEGRQPVYAPGALLKAKIGDAADPVGLDNVQRISERIKPLPVRLDATRKRVVNVFVPVLDGDLMFGGYIAFMHFLCRVAEAGHRLRFVIREDPYGSRGWFLKGMAARPRWHAAFADQEVVNATRQKTPLAVHPGDLCIAYSTWTMYDAASVAQALDVKRPLFFIQEFEPVFHDHNALHFIMSGAYDLPHLPVFNAAALEDYFRKNRIGAFAGLPPRPHFHFEHALPALDLSPDAMRRDGARRLICYARPEKHAGRNLFEVCILGLRAAIEAGVFPGDWAFFGMGALGHEYEVELADGVAMTLLPRMPQDEYEAYLKSFDVGLSLMYAPHPSVTPYELAKAGVVTVTNEFGNRDAAALARYGANIIPARCSVAGIVEGLRAAVARCGDIGARLDAARFPHPTSWDEVFDRAFIDRVFTELAQG